MRCVHNNLRIIFAFYQDFNHDRPRSCCCIRFSSCLLLLSSSLHFYSCLLSSPLFPYSNLLSSRHIDSKSRYLFYPIDLISSDYIMLSWPTSHHSITFVCILFCPLPPSPDQNKTHNFFLLCTMYLSSRIFSKMPQS